VEFIRGVKPCPNTTSALTAKLDSPSTPWIVRIGATIFAWKPNGSPCTPVVLYAVGLRPSEISPPLSSTYFKPPYRNSKTPARSNSNLVEHLADNEQVLTNPQDYDGRTVKAAQNKTQKCVDKMYDAYPITE